MTIYGQIVTPRQVKVAVQDTLRTWVVHYLADIERQEGLPEAALRPFESWSRPAELDNGALDWVNQPLPSCLTTCGGLISPPEQTEDGITAHWGVWVASVVSANDWDATNDLAGWYSAAVHAALLQHRTLGGLASGVTWADERYDPIRSSKTLAAATVLFDVRVDQVVDPLAGPRVPPDDPYAVPDDEHTVETIDLTEGILQ